MTRVASTSLVALVLPVALAFALSAEEYGAWAVLFGVAALAQYFDFGVPVAVQTMVARREATGQSVVGVLRAGLSWSALTGAVLLLIGACVGFASQEVFPQMTTDRGSVLVTLVLLVAGNAATLLGNTAAGYFLGIHRAIRAAVLLVPARVASLVLAFVVAVMHAPIALIAAAYAAPLVMAAFVVGADGLRFAVARDRGPAAGGWILDPAVLRFSGSLVVWSAGMVAINGIGVIAVGRFDFGSAPLFAILAALSTAVAGVQSALIAPVLSELGRRYAREDREGASSLIDAGTRINAAVLALALGGVLLLVPVLDDLLFDGRYAHLGVLLVVITTCTAGATALRLTMTPMTYGFIASATHSRIVAPPVIEAAGTVLFVWVGASRAGILGAAVGLALGAVLGVTLALMWSHRLSGAVAVPAARIARVGAVSPCLALLPLIVAEVVAASAPTGAAIGIAALGAALTITLLLRFVLPTRSARLVTARIRRTIRAAPHAEQAGKRA